MSTENHGCEVEIEFLGHLLGKCADLTPRPARPIRRICVHEHMRDGWVCDVHLEAAKQPGGGSCLTCYQIDGHDCRIALVPIEAAS